MPRNNIVQDILFNSHLYEMLWYRLYDTNYIIFKWKKNTDQLIIKTSNS